MGYYWQQIGWNKYKLVRDHEELEFDSYEKLYQYCIHNGINARQA